MKKGYKYELITKAEKLYVVVGIRPYFEYKKILRKIPGLNFPTKLFFEVDINVDLESSLEICDGSIDEQIVMQVAAISHSIIEQCREFNLVDPDGFRIVVLKITDNKSDIKGIDQWERV